MTRAAPVRLLAPALLALLGAAGGTAPAAADPGAVADPLQVLESAQKSYDQAISITRSEPVKARRLFGESADLYRSVAESGVENPNLYYNLGNADLQAGRVGAAIADYLKAQQLAPGDARLQQNLAQARSLVKDRFERAGAVTILESVATWWHLLSLSTRFTITIGAWIALWVLITLRAGVPRAFSGEGRTTAWRWLAGLSAAVCLASGATVAADLSMRALNPMGVITDTAVVVRKGNGEGFEPQFQESLGQGVEFRLLDRRPGWIEIELPNGRSGWIRDTQAQLV